MYCKKDKKLQVKDAKIRNLCVKNLHAVDIDAQNIVGVTGTFTSLNVENLNVKNINGVDVNCPNSTFNVLGTITPVEYVNGVPQQPPNPNNVYNQAVLDELWQLNLLANAVTELDASSGRLRNTILSNFYGCVTCPANSFECNCPVPGYAVFQGSISGNVLTVSSIFSESLTSCPPVQGVLQIGQEIFIHSQDSTFLASTIIAQLSGVEGGVGTYQIENDFNNYSSSFPSQKMLALFNLTTQNCSPVPLRIYGVETTSVTEFVDGCLHTLSSIAYDINIANKSLSTKVAAVYVQIGYQEPGSSDVVVQGLTIDTKQFDPSILSFGEQMNNNVLLPTALVQQIALFNSTTQINAVAQLTVFVEDNLKVLIPESNSNIKSRAVENDASNVAFQFFGAPGKLTVSGEFVIPVGSTNLLINAAGAGGGGGGAVVISRNLTISVPGGGGGSGKFFMTNITLTPDMRYVSYTVGMHGEGQSDGGDTIVSILDINRQPIPNFTYVAAGGKAGLSGTFVSPAFILSGNGGAGGFGGGGGGSVEFDGAITDVGNGGAGDTPQYNGETPPKGTGRGGNGGGSPLFNNGGIGGIFDKYLNGNVGGGAGGGGGGAGQDGSFGGKGGENGHVDGYSPSPSSGAGGGGAAGFTNPGGVSAQGGNGSNGFVYLIAT